MDLGVRSQSDHIEDWKLHLEADNFSPGTITNYVSRVRWFEAFLSEQGLTFKDASPKVLDAFKLSLKRIMIPRSANMYLSSARRFYSWLHWHGVIPVNYLATMKGMRTDRPLPRPFTEQEITRILEAAQLDRARWAYPFIEAQYSTGCRISEVRMLTWGDVHLDEGYASVMGKGQRGRNVPLGRFAVAALRAWMAHLATQGGRPTTGQAFLWPARGSWRINRNTMNKVIKRVGEAAGIEGDIVSHRFRHSFATHMLNRGEDIRVIQELLGHLSIQSTQVYTQVSPTLMLKAFRRAHPRA